MKAQQLRLFGEPNLDRIVNVASVSHYSPFRYPGGKTWLVPRAKQWLLSLPELPREFIEPFAGGAIISLTVAFEGLADHVTFAELDADVATVWQAILEGDGTWLADQIVNFDLTHESLAAWLSRTDLLPREYAFQTILRNRVNRGGILAPGAGMVKTGENGRGIQSRWYPQTLAKRILRIARIRDRLTLIHGDGMDVLREQAGRSDVVFFIDPPYTAAGKRAGRRLYTHSELDHGALFRLAETLAGDFLMTYDNAEGVQKLARQHGFDIQPIAIKSTHHAKLTELLIGRDLSWLRSVTV
jgi:DNA adenine methylase